MVEGPDVQNSEVSQLGTAGVTGCLPSLVAPSPVSESNQSLMLDLNELDTS